MSDLPRPPRLLVVLATLFGAVVFTDSWWRWWTFQYETFDLAFYVQALWLALRGIWQVSLLNVPLLGNHAEPIVFLAAPLFALCPHPMLLVGLQTLALATLPLTGWRIATRLGLGEPAASLLAAATVLMPATGFVALHEFHPEAFAAPLLFLLIEARLAGRLGKFWLWFGFALACKENVALMLGAFCVVHAVLDGKQDLRWQMRWNLAPLFVAATWLLLYTQVISRSLNGGNVDYLELYSHLGNSGSQIVAHFFTEPQRAFSALFRALTAGDLVWGLLLPLLALPLLRPRWLWIAAPLLLQHLLSWRASEWSIRYHYAAPLIPLFWIASAEAVTRLRWKTAAAATIVGSCVLGQIWIGPARTLPGQLRNADEKLREREWKAALLDQIPREASVTAPLPYLAHLASRGELHSLHHLLKGLKTLSRADYTPAAPTDVVIADFGDTATYNVAAGYYHPQMRTADGRIVPSSDQLLREYLGQNTWRETARNSFHLFSQGVPLPQGATDSPALTISPGTRLTGWHPSYHADSLELAFDWELGDHVSVFPWVMVVAENNREGHQETWSVIKGLVAPSVVKGLAHENWELLIPATAPAGTYNLTLLFYDHNANASLGTEGLAHEPILTTLPVGQCRVR